MKNVKKLMVILLAVMMLVSCMAVGVSAKIKEENAVGSIVYVKYVTESPNMKSGVIDESWGDVIHIDKNTKNCGMWASIKDSDGERWSPDDTECDLYFLFDDTRFYIAIYTPDKNMLGGINGGDSVCFNMEADNRNLVYQFSGDLRFFPNGYYKDYRTFGAYVDFDDSSIVDPGDTVKDFTWKEVPGGYVVKWAITWQELGVSKKDIDEGCIWNFCFIRSNATDPHASGRDGWLYWGKWFDISLAKGAASPTFYVADSPNAKGPNSWVFSKLNKKTEVKYEYVAPGSEETPTTPEPPEEPETPVTPAKEEPSSWAKAEVDKAIAAGLVPTELQVNYAKGISRENLSKILAKLLDKVYGKAAATSTAKFNDTTDKDVLYAANLGIINGYKQADGTYDFKPANTLKRSEMSVILNRVAKLCGKTVTGFDSEINFTDTASHWCKSELGWPVHMEIIKGYKESDGTYTFKPESTLTTEQTILMIYRAYEALK